MSTPLGVNKKLYKLWKRANGKCYYCRKRCQLIRTADPLHDTATIEHLYPVGDIRRLLVPGRTVMACRQCNQKYNWAFQKSLAPEKAPKVSIKKLLSELPNKLTSKTVKMEINLTVTHTFSPEAFELLGQLLNRSSEPVTAGSKAKPRTGKVKDDAPAQLEPAAEVKSETAPATNIFADAAPAVTETAAPAVDNIFGDAAPAATPATNEKPATIEDIRTYYTSNIAANAAKSALIAPQMEKMGVPFNEALGSRPISALKPEQYNEFLAFLKTL